MKYRNFVMWGELGDKLEEIEDVMREIGLVDPLYSYRFRIETDPETGKKVREEEKVPFERATKNPDKTVMVWEENGIGVYRIHIVPEHIMFRYWDVEVKGDPMLEHARIIVKEAGLDERIERITDQCGLKELEL